MTSVTVSATIYKDGGPTGLHAYLSDVDPLTEVRVGLDFDVQGMNECVEVLAVEDGVYESLADYIEVMVCEALSLYIESGTEESCWVVKFCASAKQWKGENGDFRYELSEFRSV